MDGKNAENPMPMPSEVQPPADKPATKISRRGFLAGAAALAASFFGKSETAAAAGSPAMQGRDERVTTGGAPDPDIANRVTAGEAPNPDVANRVTIGEAPDPDVTNRVTGASDSSTENIGVVAVNQGPSSRPLEVGPSPLPQSNTAEVVDQGPSIKPIEQGDFPVPTNEEVTPMTPSGEGEEIKA